MYKKAYIDATWHLVGEHMATRTLSIEVELKKLKKVIRGFCTIDNSHHTAFSFN